jgi:GTP-binding protein EngB required for normal cell division
MELPVVFVLSKIDKINKNDLEKRKRELKEVFF